MVLSHRGYWKTPDEKNTVAAFRRSFDLGFGTETDVRDRLGELVIAHDPPRGGELPFDAFLDLLGDRDLPLAINVKADGLAGAIADAFAKRPRLTRWFVFDMSVPDTLQQLARGNPTFARLSEYEPTVPDRLVDRIAGVWLDGFHGDWWTPERIEDWTTRGKTVCVVSPDLHRREPEAAWNTLRAFPFSRPDRVLLCTDRPEAARARPGGGP
jgi:hypothetical protein